MSNNNNRYLVSFNMFTLEVPQINIYAKYNVISYNINHFEYKIQHACSKNNRAITIIGLHLQLTHN